jgi:collagen type IV alpha
LDEAAVPQVRYDVVGGGGVQDAVRAEVCHGAIPPISVSIIFNRALKRDL